MAVEELDKTILIMTVAEGMQHFLDVRTLLAHGCSPLEKMCFECARHLSLNAVCVYYKNYSFPRAYKWFEAHTDHSWFPLPTQLYFSGKPIQKKTKDHLALEQMVHSC